MSVPLVAPGQGPLQPFTGGCGSPSVPVFLLLPSTVRGFCAAEKSGRGGDPPQTPPDSPAHIPTSWLVCTAPARLEARAALP